MKRSLVFVGLSLLFLAACNSAPTADVTPPEADAVVSSSSSSSSDSVPEVDVTVDADGNVVAQ